MGLINGSWVLSRLLRGQKGTNYEMLQGAVAGAWLIVLDGKIQPLPFSTDDFGLESNWRVGPSSYPVTSEAYETLSFSASGRNMRMFSPVHLSMTNNVESDEFEWVRCGRKNADSWEGAEIPLDAASEKYSVRILNVANEMVRETQVNTSQYHYPVSLKEQDFGEPNPAYVFEVCQINDFGLSGAPARIEVA